MVIVDRASSIPRLYRRAQRKRLVIPRQVPCGDLDWWTRWYVKFSDALDHRHAPFLLGAAAFGGAAYVRNAYSSEQFVRARRIETAYDVGVHSAQKIAVYADIDTYDRSINCDATTIQQ